MQDANVACPTIMTTNDMPVVEPDSFKAFNLIPFQINPHFTDVILPGHAGETREQRIEEFTEANPGIFVAGLREGTMLLRENDKLNLSGQRKCQDIQKRRNTCRICSLRRFILPAQVMKLFYPNELTLLLQFK